MKLDIEKIAEHMKVFFQDSNHFNSEGWNTTLLDYLENEYNLETAIITIIEDKE